MGTPEFAVPPLERAYGAGHDVAAVFTQPDRPRNRGMKISFSPVKEAALSHGTQVHQPESLRDPMVGQTIRELDCEVIAVVAYGKLLPRVILDLPAFGCINVHASLLPKYRGAAPIHWAIMKGETQTGVTSMLMSDKLDAGDTLLSSTVSIGDDETAGELHDRLSLLTAELLEETLDGMSSGKIGRTPQDHNEATFAPPIHKSISPIDWSDTALGIKRKVRGLNPWPLATAELNGTVCKVFSVDIGGSRPLTGAIGEIASVGSDGIEMICADGTVIIKELQAPGARRMTAAEYLRGKRINISD